MPLRDLRCANPNCRRIQEDVYFKNMEEIEFKCECGCEEYELILSAANIPKSGRYSFNDKGQSK